MRYSWGLLGLAAVAAASDVHELGKDTFNDFVKENDLVLAECKKDPDIQSQNEPVPLTSTLQSSLRGAATARRWRPSTKRRRRR